MGQRTWHAALLVATLAVGGVAPAVAEETTLIFGTGSTPGVPIDNEIYMPWTAAVNAAGKGVLHIDQRDGQVILNSSNFYNQVTNDVVQIAFGALDYVVGKFPLMSLTALPEEYGNSEIASLTFWRLYKSGALDSEFNDVVPLYVMTYPPQWFSFRKPLPDPNNLRGLKLVPTSKVGAEMIQLLDADPVTMTYQETYSALQRGTIDGIAFPMAGILSQNFGDLTSAHLALGLGTTSSMVFMTKARFNALSPEARKILMDNSGEAMSRKQGALFDRLTTEAIAKFGADPKHSIVQPTQPLLDRFAKIQAQVEAEWVAAGPGREKVLKQYKDLLAQAKAGR